MGQPVRPLPRLASLTHERFAVAPSTVAWSQLDFVKATGFLNPKPNSQDLRPESLPSNTYPRARGAKLSKGYRSMVILVCKAQSTHGTMTPMRPLEEDKSYNPSCAFAGAAGRGHNGVKGCPYDSERFMGSLRRSWRARLWGFRIWGVYPLCPRRDWAVRFASEEDFAEALGGSTPASGGP